MAGKSMCLSQAGGIADMRGALSFYAGRALCALSPILFFLVCSCAHVTVNESTEDQPLKTFYKTSDPKGQKTYIANCEEDTDTTLKCKIETEDKCDRITYDLVDRTVITEKSTGIWPKILEWGGAGILLAAGGIVTVDTGYLPDDNDPLDSNPIGKTGAYAIGGGLLAVGAGLLSLAIVDSTRAIDDIRHEGQREIEKSREEIACAKGPLASVYVTLAVGPANMNIKTGENGSFSVELARLIPKELVTSGKHKPVVGISHGNNKIHQAHVASYFSRIAAAEKKRLAEQKRLDDEQRRLEEVNRKKISALLGEMKMVLKKNRPDYCIVFMDNHPDILSYSGESGEFVKLRKCAAMAVAGNFTRAYNNLNFEEGDKHFERLLELVPEFHDVPKISKRLALGFSQAMAKLKKKGEFDEARALVEKCEKYGVTKKKCKKLRSGIDKQEIAFYTKMIRILAGKKKRDEALSLAEECLEKYPDNKPCSRARDWAEVHGLSKFDRMKRNAVEPSEGDINEMYDVLYGYLEGEDEFEKRQYKRKLPSLQRNIRKKIYYLEFGDEHVNIGDYNFSTRCFPVYVEGLLKIGRKYLALGTPRKFTDLYRLNRAQQRYVVYLAQQGMTNESILGNSALSKRLRKCISNTNRAKKWRQENADASLELHILFRPTNAFSLFPLVRGGGNLQFDGIGSNVIGFRVVNTENNEVIAERYR